MKTVYIKRNDLFKPLDMVLCNNIKNADENFIENNMELYERECESCRGGGEIERLATIDWKNEEYKPYDITDKMTPDEIREHLQSYTDDIERDCNECGGDGYFQLEPYQEFIIDGSDWAIKRLKEYGIKVGYSELLDVHVLPIYDFGTSWSMFSYSKEVDDDYILGADETLKKPTDY